MHQYKTNNNVINRFMRKYQAYAGLFEGIYHAGSKSLDITSHRHNNSPIPNPRRSNGEPTTKRLQGFRKAA